MKKDIVEYLGFEEEEKAKVGRPRLASKEDKKKSLIIAGLSFFAVTLLLIFGYGSLVGFDNSKLLGTVINHSNNGIKEDVLIDEINPIVKDITLKEKTARKLYLTVLPTNASNKKIEYISSNNSVAKVDENGKVIGIKEGKAVITAKTTDGSEKNATFNIKVIKDASGKCSFLSLDKTNNGINYELSCDNAKIKEIQYKIANEDYKKLITKKLSDSIKFSDEQLSKRITLKVVYYPNNSKVPNYSERTINNVVTTTEAKTGGCLFNIKEVKKDSAKYDITCDNASVTKIAYKIGNGSYVGIDTSNLADTVLFEESDITRVIYFNVEYVIDGTNRVKSITKSSVIEKKSEIINQGQE